MMQLMRFIRLDKLNQIFFRIVTHLDPQYLSGGNELKACASAFFEIQIQFKEYQKLFQWMMLLICLRRKEHLNLQLQYNEGRFCYFI